MFRGAVDIGSGWLYIPARYGHGIAVGANDRRASQLDCPCRCRQFSIFSSPQALLPTHTKFRIYVLYYHSKPCAVLYKPLSISINVQGLTITQAIQTITGYFQWPLYSSLLTGIMKGRSLSKAVSFPGDDT